MIGIVVRKHVVNSDALRGEALGRLTVDDAARGVGRAVRAVGADGKQDGMLHAAQLVGCGEGQLLIAAALALAGQVDNGLAAGDDGVAAALLFAELGDGAEEAAGLPGLAAEAVVSTMAV